MPGLWDGVNKPRAPRSREALRGSDRARPNFFPPARETQAKAFPSAHYFGKTYFG
jgi:hypothetical protein